MDTSDKMDALDLAIRSLKEHERKIDLLVSELEDQVIRKLDINIARERAATEVKNKGDDEKILKQTIINDDRYANEIEVVIRVRLPEGLIRTQ